MKRVVSYIAVAVAVFQIFTVSTQAMVSDDVKRDIENYATELSSLKVELTNDLTSLKNWSNQYALTFRSAMNETVSENLSNALMDENYDLAFDIMISALQEVGENAAANELSVLKPVLINTFDKTTAYTDRLMSFLEDNKDTILVADMLPLIDEVRATYNSVRVPVKALLDIYYNAYYDDAKMILNQFEMMSISELNLLFDELKEDLYACADSIEVLENELNSFKALMKDLNLDGMGFEDLLYNDVKPYITKMENLAIDVYNRFVEKQWNELRSEGEAIVSDTTKTIAERNLVLLNKIAYFEQLKAKASENFTELKNHITVNKILKRVNKLETKALKECTDAIEYVRSLLMVEDFDIILREGVTDSQVILDRGNHYLITKNEYQVNEFMSFLQVKNENAGVLVSESIYDGNRVGTKSVVKVNNEDVAMVTYHVILKGDIRANGIIDISDITYLIKTVLNHDELDQIETIAADMNDDSLLDISDITATIKKALS